MSDQKQSRPIVANAIIWAAIMIATSLILSGATPESISDKKEFLMILFIGGWFASHTAVVGGASSLKSEWACIRKRFGRGE